MNKLVIFAVFIWVLLSNQSVAQVQKHISVEHQVFNEKKKIVEFDPSIITFHQRKQKCCKHLTFL